MSKDINFNNIVPRLGSQRDAFEELCCQLYKRKISHDTSYCRLKGDGGDGGIECYSNDADGKIIGLQAKYVDSFDKLKVQASRSLDTALEIHANLVKYIICFPFDLTGKTGRGEGCDTKFKDWKKERENQAKENGRELIIESWAKSDLINLLLKYDPNGGLREYFFNDQVLSEQWFEDHLQSVISKAGPRYTPHLNVETSTGKLLRQFGSEIEAKLYIKKTINNFISNTKEIYTYILDDSNVFSDVIWPEELKSKTEKGIIEIVKIIKELEHSVSNNIFVGSDVFVSKLTETINILDQVEMELKYIIEEKYGSGAIVSQDFRQKKLEYLLSAPTSKYDSIVKLKKLMTNLFLWITSSEYYLYYENVLIMTGESGTGKTHSICDVFEKRLNSNLLSCVIFGNEFCNEPEFWNQFSIVLGLSSKNKEELLELFNSAAETSGNPFIIFLDAIDETRPLKYWIRNIKDIIESVKKYENLKICITCRSPYFQIYKSTLINYEIIEHEGFKYVEREAVVAFFNHYNIIPPIMATYPIEYSNPFYLKLLCETIRGEGKKEVPSGWNGLLTVLRSFIDVKEDDFSKEMEIRKSNRFVEKTLELIAQRILDNGDKKVSCDEIDSLLYKQYPQLSGILIIDWLINSSLIYEDGCKINGFHEEYFIRISFSRLEDFLIANKLMKVIVKNHVTDFDDSKIF